MNRSQAKKFYPILKAYAEGRVIECRTKPSTIKGKNVPNEWTEIKDIEYWNNIEYRIKPEPKYRPFKDAEECWQEMQKHQPFGWVNYNGYRVNIAAVTRTSITFTNNKGLNFTFEHIFKECTFADGAPFGVKVKR